MSKSILREKSFSFSIEIVRVYKVLVNDKEFVMSKQLLRSGTAIGALLKEAEYGQSKADFINKLSIALKEANETEYWIELLHQTKYISNEEFINLTEKVKELLRMLIASINTSKKN